jgi:hypothetical protein
LRIDFFDEPNLRHVRQVLFLLFLASQTAGGSRGLMARKAQPKFPKNRRRTRRFFFALRQPAAAADPAAPAGTDRITRIDESAARALTERRP